MIGAARTVADRIDRMVVVSAAGARSATWLGGRSAEAG